MQVEQFYQGFMFAWPLPAKIIIITIMDGWMDKKKANP
jgi:hypothetical protein